MPGGGTTDYAVEIYHEAIKKGTYDCFLSENTRLPMMFMEDAIKATTELMQAPAEHLTIRSSYNLAAISFTPKDIFESIKTKLPEFSITYSADFRQAIADSWPSSIDDSVARKDWNWKETYDLEAMTNEMLTQLRKKYES